MNRVPLSIAADHPAFAGHFPSRPVVPGVVLLDESLRAIELHRATVDGERCRIATAKFLSFVSPGEAVHLEFETSSATGPYRLRVLVGEPASERLAMTGSVSFVMSATGQSPAASAAT